MLELLADAGYVAHGYCLLWEPWLIALYAGSDILIFGAYTAIPFALAQFVRRRPEVGHRKLVLLFAAFILLCGLTHLASVATLWIPAYALHGWLKFATAVVSVTTAAVLFRIVPDLLKIPAPQELQAANERLRSEVAAHEGTLWELRQARSDLEETVARRTAELEEANARLTLVLREAGHRSKNMLTIMQSLARQTARTATDKDDLLSQLDQRIAALARATTAMIDGAASDLENVISAQMSHYIDSYPGRITFQGPDQALSPEAAQQIALALHELATNAVKYGALSGPLGSVTLTWGRSELEGRPALELLWKERNDPAAMEAAEDEGEGGPIVTSTGLGGQLLTRAVPSQLSGRAEARLTPSGLRYRLLAPLAAIDPSEGGSRAAAE